MTNKLLLGGALVASAAALLMGILTWQQTSKVVPGPVEGLGPKTGDDEPVTIAGGSLRMRSELEWTLEKSGNPAATPHYYRYNSQLPADKVEWACNYDDDPVPSTRNGVLQIEIKYERGGLSGDFHTLTYFTTNTGADLRVQVTKNNGRTVGVPMLRAFVELGDHPRSAWKATTITSSGLNPPINCSNVGGDFFLKIRPCSGTGCN